MPPPTDALPAFAPIEMTFPRPVVADPPGAAADAAVSVLRTAGLRLGAGVAVTAGSRGIVQIAEITRAVVDRVRALGYEPAIVPAMGSHGGATARGQSDLLANYGITEATMGCPIRAEMDTVPLGRTAAGVDTFMARAAWECDAVLVLNRVKPHTDFKGILESGLAKMIAIGLGKLEGARACHQHVFGIGLGAAIESATAHLLATGKVAGGVAIIENAYHEVAHIVAVPAAGLVQREIELLAEAKRLMGRLPLDELDLLICDRMGKNISGQGLDTNVIGRSPFGYTQNEPWQPGMPVVRRIVVRELSDETNGNAMGMGLVDVVTERYLRKVDLESTLINSITAMTTENAKRPHVTANDREAIALALRMIPAAQTGPRIVYVRDTLELANALISEACLPLLKGRADVHVVGAPRHLAFDPAGDLVSPFA